MTLIISSIAQNRANQAFSGDHGGSDSDISIKLLVANDQCGAIIGKGGEVVKQLREESGARISIGKVSFQPPQKNSSGFTLFLFSSET